MNTPEGVALNLSPAGPVLRFYAWLIDSIIRFVIFIILIWTLSSFGRAGEGLLLILFFLIEWFYPVYFELFHKGKTPGKSRLGIYVALANAGPITPAASLIRNLLRYVDFLPFCYGFGLICTLSNARFQRIGDIVAGTVVLHQASAAPRSEVSDISPVAPPLPLQLNEQHALIRFYQRRPLLNSERAEELAKTSGALVDGQTNAADYLSGMGRWIMGKR